MECLFFSYSAGLTSPKRGSVMTGVPVEAWMALSAPVNQPPLRQSEKLPVQSPIRIDALAAQRGSAACGVLEHPRGMEPREGTGDEASVARTRAALLVLM